MKAPPREETVRLQKFMALCGVASRRASETLIRDGRVQVDGTTVLELGTQVNPWKQRVFVDGQPLHPPPRHTYIMMNKPTGCLCTANDPQGRRTVFNLLAGSPFGQRRLISVGRLDGDSEGLLLLTDDGALAHALAHPRHGVAKVYWAWTNGHLTREQTRQMIEGVEDHGEPLRAEGVRRVKITRGGALYEVTLRQGHKREVRRLFAAAGVHVERLRRIAIGPLRLDPLLAPGMFRVLSTKEVAQLKTAPEAHDRPKKIVPSSDT